MRHDSMPAAADARSVLHDERARLAEYLLDDERSVELPELNGVLETTRPDPFRRKRVGDLDRQIYRCAFRWPTARRITKPDSRPGVRLAPCLVDVLDNGLKPAARRMRRIGNEHHKRAHVAELSPAGVLREHLIGGLKLRHVRQTHVRGATQCKRREYGQYGAAQNVPHAVLDTARRWSDTRLPMIRRNGLRPTPGRSICLLVWCNTRCGCNSTT